MRGMKEIVLIDSRTKFGHKFLVPMKTTLDRLKLKFHTYVLSGKNINILNISLNYKGVKLDNFDTLEGLVLGDVILPVIRVNYNDNSMKSYGKTENIKDMYEKRKNVILKLQDNEEEERRFERNRTINMNKFIYPQQTIDPAMVARLDRIERSRIKERKKEKKKHKIGMKKWNELLKLRLKKKAHSDKVLKLENLRTYINNANETPVLYPEVNKKKKELKIMEEWYSSIGQYVLKGKDRVDELRQSKQLELDRKARNDFHLKLKNKKNWSIEEQEGMKNIYYENIHRLEALRYYVWIANEKNYPSQYKILKRSNELELLEKWYISYGQYMLKGNDNVIEETRMRKYKEEEDVKKNKILEKQKIMMKKYFYN